MGRVSPRRIEALRHWRVAAVAKGTGRESRIEAAAREDVRSLLGTKILFAKAEVICE
jgi:hypothetical protein